jgi:hypothetical protein
MIRSCCSREAISAALPPGMQSRLGQHEHRVRVGAPVAAGGERSQGRAADRPPAYACTGTPTTSAPPGGAQRVRGEVRLQHGRSIYGRSVRRHAHRGASAPGSERLDHPGFAGPGILVYFADHLVHSIQIDPIMSRVQRGTVAVINDGLSGGGGDASEVPGWAVPVASPRIVPGCAVMDQEMVD